MLSKNVLSLFIIGLCISFSSPTWAAEVSQYEVESTKIGVEGRFNFSPYTNYLTRMGTTYPSMNLSGGLRAKYFTSANFGFFTGLDIAQRNYEHTSGQISGPTFFDIPVGIEFRHQGALGFSSAVSSFRLGLYMALPNGDLLDYGNVSTGTTKRTFGVMLEVTALVPIWKGIHLGPSAGLKYGLRSPFEGNQNYPSVSRVTNYFDLNFGVATAYYF